MFYVLIGLIYFLGLGLSYLFFRPYLKRFPSKLIYTWVLVLSILALGGYVLVYYSTKGPDFFEAGVEQLRRNNYVNSKVGDFQSYSYNEKSFKESNDQAVFEVELIGKGQVLSVTCTMIRNKNNWLLSKIKLQKLTNQIE